MKTTLLASALILAGASAVSAQDFNASDWAKNQQAFNSTKTFTYGEDGKSLTVGFGEGESKGLRRAEIANKTPLTLGGANTVVVFKLTYENATFINFDKNMIYVRRQMRTTSEAATEETAVAPYFITNQNSNAGRYAANNKPEDTEAYYWRYLPGLNNENVTPTVAPDWSKEFAVPASFANNAKYTFDGVDTWGFSYLGIRLNHSADNEEGNPGVLGNDATATFNYIAVVSPEALGFESADEMNAAQSAAVGKKVQAYIENAIKGNSSAVGVLSANAPVIMAGAGIVKAAGASALEVYTLSGVKAAKGAEEVAVAPGLYLVKAVGPANETAYAKVVVK